MDMSMTSKKSTRLRKVIHLNNDSNKVSSESIMKSNGTVMSTPKTKSESSGSSSSLWLSKTPEEIVEFYRKLGPNWKNEFEKTDLTYSPSSPWYNKEVVPGSGIPVIPNMSREPVGHYADMLRKRRNSPLDISTYAVDRDTFIADRRASLMYGLNHSPSVTSSTPASSHTSSHPHHYHTRTNNSMLYTTATAHHQDDTKSSFMSSISNSWVAIFITKVFTFVYSLITNRNEGVDVVDNSATHAQRVQFEYKTGAKRTSTNPTRAISQQSSSWSQSIMSTFYMFTSWLIETNFKIFTYKDRSAEKLPATSGKYWKYLLWIPLLALIGFCLFALPLPHSDFVTPESTSTASSLPSLESFYSPINTFTNSIYSSFSTATTSLNSNLVTSANYFQSIKDVLKSVFWILSSFILSMAEVLRDCFTCGIGLFCHIVTSLFGIFLTNLTTFTTILPSYSSKVSETSGTSSVHQTSPEEIVAHILKDPRFEAMLEQTLKTSNDFDDFKAKFQHWSEQIAQLKSQMKNLESDHHSSNQVLIQQIDLIDQKLKDKFKCCDNLPSSVSIEDVKVYVNQVLTPDRLRNSLDEAYVNKYDMEVLTKQVNEIKQSVDEAPRQASLNASLIEDIKESIKHDVYKQLSQHYATLKTELTQTLQVQKVAHQEDVKDIDIDAELNTLIDQKISHALATYDADKTGLTDFALESAGGHVIDIRCTETYTLREPYYVLFGYVLWRRDSTPRKAIQPGLLPGDCWAFRGAVGCLVLKLSHLIEVTKFSIEHIPKSLTPNGKVDSAPKKFVVLGLTQKYDSNPTFLGEFIYNTDGPTLQFFEAINVNKAFDIVELKIQSNWGNIEYTCLYRFRVHGKVVSSRSGSTSEPNFNDFTSSNHNTYESTETKYNPT